MYSDVLRIIVLTLQLQNDHSFTLVIVSNEGQSGFLKLFDVLRVHLVPVSVTLMYDSTVAIQFPRDRTVASVSEMGRTVSQTHSASKVDFVDLGHVDHNLVFCIRVKLGRVCT